jgi:hypothetical protein
MSTRSRRNDQNLRNDRRSVKLICFIKSTLTRFGEESHFAFERVDMESHSAVTQLIGRLTWC